jgi:hypothetical protein
VAGGREFEEEGTVLTSGTRGVVGDLVRRRWVVAAEPRHPPSSAVDVDVDVANSQPGIPMASALAGSASKATQHHGRVVA